MKQLHSYQQPLFNDFDNDVVNVASVPQRSPFRYPGGKTWLVPKIRLWLNNKPITPSLFIEPFVGGGIISLTVAAERLAEKVLMVELDEFVSSVWQTIIEDEKGAHWLAEKIVSFNLTLETVQVELSKKSNSSLDQAFQAVLKNRVNRGGIMAPGAGLLKKGENGKGLSSRWYPETLKKRILSILEFSDRINFVHGDGMEVIRQYTALNNVVYFIDPPYTASKKRAGTRLYIHSHIDHEELFRIAKGLTGDFLMTYDNAEEVRSLANFHGFDTQAISMKNTHHAQMTELLIGRNLDWLRH